MSENIGEATEPPVLRAAEYPPRAAEHLATLDQLIAQHTAGLALTQEALPPPEVDSDVDELKSQIGRLVAERAALEADRAYFFKRTVALAVELDHAKVEAEKFRIEGDCGLRDYDALELEHGLLQGRSRLQAEALSAAERERDEAVCERDMERIESEQLVAIGLWRSERSQRHVQALRRGAATFAELALTLRDGWPKTAAACAVAEHDLRAALAVSEARPEAANIEEYAKLHPWMNSADVDAAVAPREEQTT